MQDMYKRFLWDMGAKLACDETSERRPSLSRNITSLSGSSAPGGAVPNTQESGFTGNGCSVNSCPGDPGSETSVTECGMSLSSMSSQSWNDIVQINCIMFLLTIPKQDQELSPCSCSGLSLPGRGHVLVRCSHTVTGLRTLFLFLPFLDLLWNSLVPFTP